ncbi:MAG: nucleoside monophosphate kinase [Bacilli bacterium]|nr:nucleoside monophosphate kinase [Bacilli bacterium]
MKNIILLAPPAAGKGTVAKYLCDTFGYVSISTGDMLREEAKSNEELKAIMESGKLVGDDIVFDLLKAKLNKLGNTPYILDGFPRTVNQAVMYDELLQNIERELGVVIYLDVDKEELKERVVSRIVCPECKASYSTREDDFAPKNGNLCDKCNIELVHRDDDSEEVFYQRYEEYLAKTMSLIDYYEGKGLLVRIGDTDPVVVFDKVSSLVKEND